MKVKVEKIEVKTLLVECKKISRQKKLRVVLEGEVLDMAYDRVKYPSSVEVVTVTTNQGDFSLASYTLPTYVNIPFGFDSGREYDPGERVHYFRRGSRRFNTRITLPGCVKLNFKVTKQLKPGQSIGVQGRPFRLMGSVVTDGEYIFPLRRPKGQEWKEHEDIDFAKGVSGDNWLLMLRAIVGLTFEGSIDEWNERITKRTRSIKTESKRIRVLEERLKKGQCFTGNGMQKVAIGRNLVFVGLKDGKPVYIVDAPEYGRALYIFGERQVAFDWASRKIDSKVAREKATLWTPHVGAWEERTSLAI